MSDNKKITIGKKYITFDTPPSIHDSLPLLDNKTKGLGPLKFNAENISLAKILEEEVNKAQAEGNRTLVDELNGIILCFMQLRNQCSQLLTSDAHKLEVVRVIKHKVLGMWNQ